MGKSGYKRFKKSEKAKVKLKGNKALLPKGQNVTDTNFKVKKIIVKEQLKTHSENDLLTKKHLSIKELISRLSHHNVNMRQDALSGLKELVSDHGPDIVQANLSPLLLTTMSLTIDRESDVRKDTLKLLSVIFDKVSEEELLPLFPAVVCHLKCAMTHIESGIRADSLRLLDIMLAKLPALTASHTHTLLPHFLDLISHRSSSGSGDRTLSLHLDGQVTSEKWRSRVIGRLNKLFSVILEHSQRGRSQSVRNVKWTADKHTYLALYSPVALCAKNPDNASNLPMKDYANVLMPLLLDTFTEAVPKQAQEDTQTACVVGVDVAALLQSIVEVILRVWRLLKQSSIRESLTELFQKTWGDSVGTRLIQERFPYSVSATTSRKRQRDADKVLAALQLSQPSCSLLNLELCLLAFLLSRRTDLWDQSIQYIKRNLRDGASLRPEESDVLCLCLEASSIQLDTGDNSSTSSLLSVVSRSNILKSVDKPVNMKAFDFLTKIALRPSHHFHQDKHFTTWLDSLPALLCKPSVSLSTVRNISAIAARNLPAFVNSLDGWIEEVLGNLPALTVTEDKGNEGHRLIINLVYWITDWDQDMVQTIQQLIQQGTLGDELTNHLVDVIRLKTENTEDPELKIMLQDILPQ